MRSSEECFFSNSMEPFGEDLKAQAALMLRKKFASFEFRASFCMIGANLILINSRDHRIEH